MPGQITGELHISALITEMHSRIGRERGNSECQSS